jgi:O-antigen ligase
MGLVGFIPFVLLLIKAVKNIKTTLTGQHNDHILALVSLFFASFLESISTGTLVLNSSFWVLFYLMGISDQNTVSNRRKRFNRLFGSIIITSFVHKHE